jgi:hypothetical protein
MVGLWDCDSGGHFQCDALAKYYYTRGPIVIISKVVCKCSSTVGYYCRGLFTIGKAPSSLQIKGHRAWSVPDVLKEKIDAVWEQRKTSPLHSQKAFYRIKLCPLARSATIGDLPSISSSSIEPNWA